MIVIMFARELTRFPSFPVSAFFPEIFPNFEKYFRFLVFIFSKYKQAETSTRTNTRTQKRRHQKTAEFLEVSNNGISILINESIDSKGADDSFLVASFCLLLYKVCDFLELLSIDRQAGKRATNDSI